MIAGHRAELSEITQQCNALTDRVGVLDTGCEAESTRLLDTEPPSFLMMGVRPTPLGPEGRVLMKGLRVLGGGCRRIGRRLHQIQEEVGVLGARPVAEEEGVELGILAELSEKAVSDQLAVPIYIHTDIALFRRRHR